MRMALTIRTGKRTPEVERLLSEYAGSPVECSQEIRDVLTFAVPETIDWVQVCKNEGLTFISINPIKADIVNDLYEQYQNRTEGRFHTALWQILVNEVRDVKAMNSCLVYIYTGEHQVGVADRDKPGYTPGLFSFKPDVPLTERKQIIDDLNARIFGLSPDECAVIVASSMKTPIKHG